MCLRIYLAPKIHYIIIHGSNQVILPATADILQHFIKSLRTLSAPHFIGITCRSSRPQQVVDGKLQNMCIHNNMANRPPNRRSTSPPYHTILLPFPHSPVNLVRSVCFGICSSTYKVFQGLTLVTELSSYRFIVFSYRLDAGRETAMCSERERIGCVLM